MKYRTGYYLANQRPITSLEWSTRSDAALAWLQRSIAATGNRGSAHSFALHKGWAKAYPETTGYLIETLFDYAESLQRPDLRQTALDCANWLLTIQLGSGAFPALTAGNTMPSMFNTGQILFGLTRTAEELPPGNAQHAACMRAISHAVQWMLAEQEPDGSWRQWAYVSGFVPTYYTRAVWGVLKANSLIKNEAAAAAMRQALHLYSGRFLPNHSVQDWGFWPGKPAFTHTIAYTLEGFLECAVLLNEPEILEKTKAATDHLLSVCIENKRTAGAYDADWKGDYSFICCTGNAQLSMLCHRFWQLTGDEKYQQAAKAFLLEVVDYQSNSWLPGLRGAFPGSVPVWGKYLPLRYPNWGVKFFLDAWGRVFA
ncbi:MAG: hypothetical protein IT262_19390 [Saprospiraceae bacterium]|nr:hypothetical protein [Saprospiraceae bacterium]